jgi:hypothetical protein
MNVRSHAKHAQHRQNVLPAFKEHIIMLIHLPAY